MLRISICALLCVALVATIGFAVTPSHESSCNTHSACSVESQAALYECNHCHQQYQGSLPPAFAKCPSNPNPPNHHWWIQKFRVAQ